MKAGFDLGTKVRSTKNPNVVGTLVPGPAAERPGWKFPHYEGEGFYTVKWDSLDKSHIVHEDDVELFFSPAPEEQVNCPMCGGGHRAHGQFGKRAHYNCRDCGAWSS